MIRSFQDLEAWKEGHKLVLLVYGAVKKFPKDETFGLSMQMRRCSVSITSNIAEGFGRNSYKEKTQFYYVSQGSVSELQNQLIIAKDVGYISPKDYQDIYDLASTVHRMVYGLIKYAKAHS